MERQKYPKPEGFGEMDQNKASIQRMLTERFGREAPDRLQEYTTWEKDGKTIPGKRDVLDLGKKQATFVVRQVREDYDAWRASKKPDHHPAGELDRGGYDALVVSICKRLTEAQVKWLALYALKWAPEGWHPELEADVRSRIDPADWDALREACAEGGRRRT